MPKQGQTGVKPVGRPLGSKHDERTRQKIKTSQLLNRLMDHVLKDNEMKSTQIRAAEILLNKTLPNLQATTFDGDVATTVTFKVSVDQ